MQRSDYLNYVIANWMWVSDYLANRVYYCRHIAWDHEKILDVLLKETLVRVKDKVEFEKLETEGMVKAAMKRQASDVFNYYWGGLKERKADLQKYKAYYRARCQDNLAQQVEFRDLFHFLQQQLKESEYALFYARLVLNYKFEELAEQFSRNATVLRQQYHRIKEKVIDILKKENAK